MTGLTLVLIGGFAQPGPRVWFWLAALVADLATARLAGRRVWVLQPGHFAERHGLIVIIALGESLIAAGVASSAVERSFTFALTTAGAVIATCALWWTYFGTLHRRFEGRMDSQDDMERGGFARDVFSFWHAAVVAGVISMAVAFEEAIAHPDVALESGPAGALTIGAVLFVGGLAAAAWRAGISVAVVPRSVVAFVALAATPLVSQIPAAAALWGLAFVVTAMDIVEARTVVRPS